MTLVHVAVVTHKPVCISPWKESRGLVVTGTITSLKRLRFPRPNELIFHGKLCLTSFLACSGRTGPCSFIQKLPRVLLLCEGAFKKAAKISAHQLCGRAFPDGRCHPPLTGVPSSPEPQTGNPFTSPTCAAIQQPLHRKPMGRSDGEEEPPGILLARRREAGNPTWPIISFSRISLSLMF